MTPARSPAPRGLATSRLPRSYARPPQALSTPSSVPRHRNRAVRQSHPLHTERDRIAPLDKICKPIQRVDMSVELKIAFDGTTPGLEEHRLSLSAFGESLKLLLAALQRTASAILASASEDPEYGSRGGKFAEAAKLLDLELAAVEEGSAAPSFVCTARAPGPYLPHVNMSRADLAEAAIERLVQDIEAESSGKARSPSVRRYLRSLPRGVNSQRYTATRDGKTLRDVRFSTATLADPPRSLPRLIKVTGHVISVGFEPGQSFISLKVGTKTMKCSASVAQVESAINLRMGPVTATVLDSDKPSIVWIKSAEQPADVPTLDDTIEHLHSNWKRTLEALAR